jgi:hypothetical protein
MIFDRNGVAHGDLTFAGSMAVNTESDDQPPPVDRGQTSVPRGPNFWPLPAR